MGNLIDKEPKYNEGWGFCSTDPRTKNCNEVIDISATDSRGTNIVRDQGIIYYIERLRPFCRGTTEFTSA